MFGIHFVFIERWLNDGSGRQERGAARPPASRLNRNSGHSYPPGRQARGRGRLALPGLAGAALLALVLCAGDAQAAAVCDNTPVTGDWIECEVTTDDIDIDAKDLTIETMDVDAHGIHGSHLGTGSIGIDVENTTIETMGASAHGVNARHRGIGDIDITLTGGAIHATGARAHGVFSRHFGTGDTDITLQDGTTITTGKNDEIGHAVFAERTALPGAGDITITTRGAAITTENSQSYGVFGHQDDLTTSGDITIDAQGGTINVTGNISIGIAAWKQGGTGDITIGARNITIDAVQYGVYGHHQSIDTGDVSINVEDLAITTTGASQSHGVFGWRRGSGGGTITIDVQGGSITTKGLVSHGLYGEHRSTGDVNITTRGVAITTESVETDPTYFDTFSHGVVGFLTGAGNVDIKVLQGSSITAKGAISHGVYARHTGTGDITITTSATVATEGPGGHGVYAELDSGMGEIGVSVGGGSVTASGVGSNGVKVGRIAVTDHDMDPNTPDINVPQRAAEVGEDGYRKQTVTVNGPVVGGMGEAAAVFLAGGGKVVIGLEGSLRAASGIAILATGDTPGANPVDPAIPPKLRVDLNLGGRRVAQAIGDDWIVNDGGETTIAVNSVVLHDGETGVTDAVARNGAWNVRMRAEGVTVTDRADPDPANWVITEPAAGVVADRDFSAGDFNETARPKPPPPPPMTCPEGQVGTPPDCMTPPKRVSDGSGDAVSVFLEGGGRVVKYVFDGLLDAAVDFLEAGGEPAAGVVDGRYFYTEDLIETPDSRQFHEVYAPRAALYEALPGFLLRLNGGGPEGERLRSPGSPVWARLSGSTGSHAPERSTVGQEYDFERLAVEAGLDVSLGESLSGSISVRHVRGSAEVTSPFGGGDIEAEGLGVSIGTSWRIAGGWYANGSLLLTDYDVDVSSGDMNIGTLKRDASARGALLSLEAGRRIRMSERMSLTPRAWATRSEVSIDKFTDAVDARFSAPDAERFTGGAGIVAETGRTWDGGTFSLRGSVDLEQKLDDAETAVDVSGAKLESKSAKTRVLLGLGGVYRKGRFSVSGEVSMGGLGSDDTQYAGRVSFGMRF